MLHPKYRSLKCCTNEERLRCQQYIREQLKIIGGIATTATVVQEVEPPPKKFKVADDLFSRFEDDNSYGMEENEDQATGYESDEYTFNDKKTRRVRQIFSNGNRQIIINQQSIRFLENSFENISVAFKISQACSFNSCYIN
ncbi:unnamed protein product [Rotaria magnacalcarata]|nr:unnamed protein product [Rotaria magnacalcarata]